MSNQEMYQEFRIKYPDITQMADIRFEDVWDDLTAQVNVNWFECVADIINQRMGLPEHRAEITSIFKFFEMKSQTGNAEVRKCIDVCFVENLFHGVNLQHVVRTWSILPANLQKLYIELFGRPPRGVK